MGIMQNLVETMGEAKRSAVGIVGGQLVKRGKSSSKRPFVVDPKSCFGNGCRHLISTVVSLRLVSETSSFLIGR